MAMGKKSLIMRGFGGAAALAVDIYYQMFHSKISFVWICIVPAARRAVTVKRVAA